MTQSGGEGKSQGKSTTGASAQRVSMQISKFIATKKPDLTEQEKIQNAEEIVKILGFSSLEEFNKYDEAVQAAKRRRPAPGDDA